MKNLVFTGITRAHLTLHASSVHGINDENILVRFFPASRMSIVSMQHPETQIVYIFLYNALHKLERQFDAINPGTFYSSQLHDNILVNCIINSIDDSLMVFFTSGLILRVDAHDSSIEPLGLVEEGISERGVWLSPDSESLIILTMSDENHQYLVVLAVRSLETMARIDVLDENQTASVKPVNVGWGSAETQFRGKGAKAIERAQGQPSLESSVEKNLILKAKSQISLVWHPDSSKFALVSQNGRLSIYSRDGVLLHSGIKADICIGSPIAWNDQYGHGYGIAALLPSGSSIGFWEPNCQLHGKPFEISRKKVSVRMMQWNYSGTIFLILLSENIIQLWTTTAYHFDLKREIVFNGSTIISTAWIAEDEFVVFSVLNQNHIDNKTQKQGILYNFRLSLLFNPSFASLMTIEGQRIRVTSQKQGIVPPPLCRTLAVHPTNQSFAVSTDSSIDHCNIIIAVTSNGSEIIGFKNDPSGASSMLFVPMKIFLQASLFSFPVIPRSLQAAHEALLLHVTFLEAPAQDELAGTTICLEIESNSIASNTETHKEGPNNEALLVISMHDFSVQKMLLFPSSIDVSLFYLSNDKFLYIFANDGSVFQCLYFYLKTRFGALLNAETTDIGQTHYSSGEVINVSDEKIKKDKNIVGLKCIGQISNDIVLQCQGASLVFFMTRHGMLWCIHGEKIVHISLPFPITSFALVNDGEMVLVTTEKPTPALVLVQIQLKDTQVLNVYDTMKESAIIDSHVVEPGSTIIGVQGPAVTLLIMPRGSTETIYLRKLLRDTVYQLIMKQEIHKAYNVILRHRVPFSILFELDSDKDVTSSLVSSLNSQELIQILADVSLSESQRKLLRDAALSRVKATGMLQVAVAAEILLGNIDDAMGILAFMSQKQSSERQVAISLAITLLSREHPMAAVQQLVEAALASSYDLSLAKEICEAGHLRGSDAITTMHQLERFQNIKGYPLRHAIDDWLMRCEKALRWLAMDSTSTVEEVIGYIERRNLYHDAFDLFFASRTHINNNSNDSSILCVKMNANNSVVNALEDKVMIKDVEKQEINYQRFRAPLLQSYAVHCKEPRAFLAAKEFKEALAGFRDKGSLMGIVAALQALEEPLVPSTIESLSSSKAWLSTLLVTQHAWGDDIVDIILRNVKATGRWEETLVLLLMTKRQEEMHSVFIPVILDEAEEWLQSLSVAVKRLNDINSSLLVARDRPEVNEFENSLGDVNGGDDIQSIISTASATHSKASHSSSRSRHSSVKTIARKRKTASKPSSPLHEWFLFEEARSVAEPLLSRANQFSELVEAISIIAALEAGIMIPKHHKLSSIMPRKQLMESFKGFISTVSAILALVPQRKRVTALMTVQELDDVFRETVTAHASLSLLISQAQALVSNWDTIILV